MQWPAGLPDLWGEVRFVVANLRHVLLAGAAGSQSYPDPISLAAPLIEPHHPHALMLSDGSADFLCEVLHTASHYPRRPLILMLKTSPDTRLADLMRPTIAGFCDGGEAKYVR